MKCMREIFVLFSAAMLTLLVVLCVSLPSSPHIKEIQEAISSSHSSKVRLVKKKFTLNITEPKVNPVLGEVTWLEDLSENDPPVCTETEPFILAMVVTAVQNAKERDRVRQSWGSKELYQYTGLKAVFVVGFPSNETLQESLETEMNTHQDIIQSDFIDTYRNLTYKTISLLSWVRDFCPGATFIAKIDDDVLVNPFNLRLYLYKHLLKNPSPMNIHGRARFKATPKRNSKWAVTEKEYPNTTYPPIVLGSAYIMDRNAVDLLLAYIPYVPMLWLEDVYLTGLVANKAGIKLKQAEKLLFAKRPSNRLFIGKVAFLIDPREKEYKQAWTKIRKFSRALIKKLKAM